MYDIGRRLIMSAASIVKWELRTEVGWIGNVNASVTYFN